MGFTHRSSLPHEDDEGCLPCFAPRAEVEVDVEEEQRRDNQRRRSEHRARRQCINFLNDEWEQFRILVGTIVVMVSVVILACVLRDGR